MIIDYFNCDINIKLDNHVEAEAFLEQMKNSFKKIERLLRQGEEIQITKRRRVIARLVPESVPSTPELPDFLGRIRAIYGNKVFEVSGAQLIAEDRDRY